MTLARGMKVVRCHLIIRTWWAQEGFLVNWEQTKRSRGCAGPAMSSLHESRQASGLPKKSCWMRRRQESAFWRAERRLRKTRFWYVTEKQPFWKEKTNSSKGLDMHESEHQSDIKSQRSLLQSSSALMTRCHTEYVWSRNNWSWLTKRARLSTKHWMRSAIRSADWTFSRSSWMNKNPVSGDLLEARKEVHVRMCRRRSESNETANVFAMPKDEATASQVLTRAQGMFTSTPAAHQACLPLAEGVPQDMLQRKVHVERNDTAPDLGSGSDSESGVHSFVHPLGTSHTTRRAHSSSIQKPSNSTETIW